MNLRIASWNVNGMRSVINKNALSWLEESKVDILCLQETRCPKEIIENFTQGNFAFKTCIPHEKPGYAGVAVLSRYKYKQLTLPDEIEIGRAISLDFGGFILVNLYVPNSKPGLVAQPMRTNIWEPAIRNYIASIKTKPVIVVGDFNVAPSNELDIYMPKPPTAHGASPIERSDYNSLLNYCKLVDTYRSLHPTTKKWTWFSNFGNAREKNHGWRIDMALISASHLQKVVKSEILSDVMGSDHRPIILEIKK